MLKLEQLILPLVLISVLAIKAGHALECYTCDSSIEPECAEIKKSTTMKQVTCKPSELGQNVGDWLKELTRIDFYETSEVNVPMVCQKIIAKDEQNKLVTFRGCQLDGGKTDVCETVKKKGGSILIEFCETCKEDGCNKSSTHFTKLWLLLIPMILVKNLF